VEEYSGLENGDGNGYGARIVHCAFMLVDVPARLDTV
jgi:hypothetical protein